MPTDETMRRTAVVRPAHTFKPATGSVAPVVEGDGWRFEPASSAWMPSSSGRKRLMRGVYWSAGSSMAAVAVCHVGDLRGFGVECETHGRLGHLGVGPELLQIVGDVPCGNHERGPAIIQQDAGISLDSALCGATVPGACERALSPLGTRGRHIENAKIAFDVACQLKAMHDSGAYHRDVRTANICVRFHGPEPRDIRATVIDFELAASTFDGEPSARSLPYYETLFSELPQLYNPGRPPLHARPLDIDMGYFTIMCLELAGLSLKQARDQRLDWLNCVDFIPSRFDFVTYDERGALHARAFDQACDLDPLAQLCRLERASDHAFVCDEVQQRVRSLIHHGGYLDRYDTERIELDPVCALATVRERLAELFFEQYLDRKRAQGSSPSYKSIDELPDDFAYSLRDQAMHVVPIVEQMGYAVVHIDRASGQNAVRAFSADEIESIAHLEQERFLRERAHLGWVYDPELAASDPVAKRSPNLVPYDRLAEADRKYNKDFALNLIANLSRVGFGVVRP